MKLPLGFGDLNFEDWGLGVVSAFISGGANAVTAGFSVNMVDPKDFNLTDPAKMIKVMCAAFVISGFFNMMNFLRNKPIPEHKIVTTTVQETTRKPQAIVVKTVEEVHTEPVDAGEP